MGVRLCHICDPFGSFRCFMSYPGVLVSIGPDLHAVSSAKPAILLWFTASTCNSPRFWLTAFQSHLEKSFAATTNLLIPTTPMSCVLRNVPVAALDHLRGGESILPLPQPASISVAEIFLRDLVERTQDVDRVQHL